MKNPAVRSKSKGKLILKVANPVVNVFDNNIDPFIPELWANESLAILEENMVAAGLIHRDFEPEFAKYGDIVHTRRPGEFVSYRKTPIDNVTVQDATATDVQVPLDQHVHVSFLIKDGEESKSFKDLVEIYMAPAMLAQARFIDRVVLGQYPKFLKNAFGSLNGLTTSNARQNILGLRQTMNQNKAYMEGRNLILTPATEATLLNLDIFTQAQQVGDQGEALQEAYLGRKYGYNMYMCQNMAGITSDAGANVAGTINHSGGYAKGATVMTITGAVGALANGQWIQVAGDDSPQQITAHTETLGVTTSVTVYPGLRAAVSNGAAITIQDTGVVNLSGGYAIGWAKQIAYTSFTDAPQVGQLLTFNTDAGVNAKIYTVVQVDTVNSLILLDRPLEAAIANSDKINLGPAGQYNFAFHRNALTLVVRPLAMPRQGTGALSAVVNHNDLSMRATITYSGSQQGHLVTLDMLCGIAVLDTNLGGVLLG